MTWRVLSVILLLCLHVGMASAATAGKGGRLNITPSGGNTATAGVGTTGGSSTFGELLSKPSALSGGRLEFEALLKMPFKPKDHPADNATVKGALTPQQIAKMLRGGVAAYAAGEAFQRLAQEACVRLMGGSMQATPAGAWEECVPGQPAQVSDGFEYSFAGINGSPTIYRSKQAACSATREQAMASIPSNLTLVGEARLVSCGVAQALRVDWQMDMRSANGTVTTYGRSVTLSVGSSSCAAGKYVWADGTCRTDPPVSDVTWRPITPSQVEAKLDTVIRDNARKQNVIDAIKDYLDKDGTIEVPPLTVTGPASSPTSTTTSTQTTQTANGPQTTTTTITNVTNYTYNDNRVTGTQVTTTTTKTPDGQTTSQTTSQSTPEQDSGAPDDSVSDTPLPPLPKLYERKYPDGMIGVWGDFKGRLSGSSLSQFATGLMPTFDSGTCPQWMVNLNFGNIGFGLVADFGSHDVAPPCWVWDALRAILIVCALLLARALIFGG